MTASSVDRDLVPVISREKKMVTRLERGKNLLERACRTGFHINEKSFMLRGQKFRNSPYRERFLPKIRIFVVVVAFQDSDLFSLSSLRGRNFLVHNTRIIQHGKNVGMNA